MITTCIPYFGGIDSTHLACVIKLGVELPDIQIAALYNIPYIDQARSIAATKHMEDSDVLVFIDHDMVFEPSDVQAIVASALEANAVVGAPYCTRHKEDRQVCGFIKELPVTFYQGGGIVEATGLGCGFTAIPTWIFHQMAGELDLKRTRTCIDALAYPFFHCEVDQDAGLWFGEDLSFCRRLTRMGLKFYCDTRIRVGHKGGYVYQLEDAALRVPKLETLTLGGKK